MDARYVGNKVKSSDEQMMGKKGEVKKRKRERKREG
jgi:hypothetical protein